MEKSELDHAQGVCHLAATANQPQTLNEKVYSSPFPAKPAYSLPQLSLTVLSLCCHSLLLTQEEGCHQ